MMAGRGAAGVVAYGTPADGAVSDDADGRTINGRDRSDDTNSHPHDGRDCCPDDGGCTYSNAGDADGRTRNGWRRLRNASDAGDADGRTRNRRGRLRNASDARDSLI